MPERVRRIQAGRAGILQTRAGVSGRGRGHARARARGLPGGTTAPSAARGPDRPSAARTGARRSSPASSGRSRSSTRSTLSLRRPGPCSPRLRLVFHLKYPTTGMPNVANTVSSSPSMLGSTCVAPNELEDAARQRVGREQEKRHADPARQHLVAARVVLLLVGEVPQVPHGEERGAPFDHASRARKRGARDCPCGQPRRGARPPSPKTWTKVSPSSQYIRRRRASGACAGPASGAWKGPIRTHRGVYCRPGRPYGKIGIQFVPSPRLVRPRCCERLRKAPAGTRRPAGGAAFWRSSPRSGSTRSPRLERARRTAALPSAHADEGVARLSRVPARTPRRWCLGRVSPAAVPLVLLPRFPRRLAPRRPARRPRSLRPLSSFALVAPGGRASRPRVPTNRSRRRRPLATPNISAFRRGRARVRARRARAGAPGADAHSLADARARRHAVPTPAPAPSRRRLRNRRPLPPSSTPRSSIRRSP